MTGHPQLRVVSAGQSPHAEKQHARRDQRVISAFDRRIDSAGVCLSETSRRLLEQISLRQHADRRSRYQRRKVGTAVDTQLSRHGDEPQSGLRQSDARQSEVFAASQQVRAVDNISLNCSTTQAAKRAGIVRTYRIVTRIGLVLTHSRCGIRFRLAAFTTRIIRRNTPSCARTSAFPTIEERTGQHLYQHEQSDKNAAGH